MTPEVTFPNGAELPTDQAVHIRAAAESGAVLVLALDEIRVGPRYRHDMGDLRALADSMNELGLLQPIGVTADFALVFGERRLRAARMLGWTTIAARIVDVPSIVAGEYAENEVRKDFTPSERVAIAEAIRAAMGDRRGSNQYVTKERPENFPDAPKGAETRVMAARKAGFGNETTYRQARTVVEQGAPNVVAAMDAGEVSISAAARAVNAAPKEEQSRWTVADIRRAAKEAAIGPVPLPTPRQARERSRQTGALVLASDGKYHAHTTAEQDKAADDYSILRFELLQDIAPLDPADAVASVPEPMRNWVTARAAERLAWFERFITLWRERHAA
ncbi:MAG: ParB/RepB/Spo0J family partition protein [Defluviicoccus sp.]|nr:ParB/RepB/Spo0J family partition protein [Defluviicoccus sp.]MDG4591499.1 ParB/RepB/Spo0J family partition protein [Defluviicoccus sp.]